MSICLPLNPISHPFLSSNPLLSFPRLPIFSFLPFRLLPTNLLISSSFPPCHHLSERISPVEASGVRQSRVPFLPNWFRSASKLRPSRSLARVGFHAHRHSRLRLHSTSGSAHAQVEGDAGQERRRLRTQIQCPHGRFAQGETAVKLKTKKLLALR